MGTPASQRYAVVAPDGELKYCAKCGKLLVLERIVPKLGPLPEVKIYKCLECGSIVTIQGEESVPYQRLMRMTTCNGPITLTDVTPR